jgi:Tfp pilus assembly protein PilE
MKRTKNETGFTIIEALLVVLILVVIGAVGYMVYHNDHNTNSTNNTVSKSATSSSKSTTATNPYAGWRQFCSSSGGLCLKYPSNWKLSGSDSNGYTITSPSGTTAVNYLPKGTPDDGMYGYENATDCPSSILSVKPLTTNASNLDIVQAITNCTANVNDVTSSTPSSSVIPALSVASQGIKAGSTDSNSLNITLVNNNTTSTARQLLYLSNLSGATYVTSSAAQQWFSNIDVQTANKILSSTSYIK